MTARDVLLAALCAGIAYYLARDVWRARREGQFAASVERWLTQQQPKAWL